MGLKRSLFKKFKSTCFRLRLQQVLPELFFVWNSYEIVNNKCIIFSQTRLRSAFESIKNITSDPGSSTSPVNFNWFMPQIMTSKISLLERKLSENTSNLKAYNLYGIIPCKISQKIFALDLKKNNYLTCRFQDCNFLNMIT